MSHISSMAVTGRATFRSTRPLILAVCTALWLGGCAMKMPSFSGIGSAKSNSISKTGNQHRSRGAGYDAPGGSGGTNSYRPASPWVWSKSGRGTREIVVKPGESLYGISSRRNVAISEIMAANQMSSPAVVPGQRLIVPVSRSESRVTHTADFEDNRNRGAPRIEGSRGARQSPV